ncbi:hypothetical protein [Sulfitobacter undariae]|nr:hypothetical protein [Sulfitobacter undariae]
MKKFLADIDAGKVFRAKVLQNNREAVGSALRGLIETARARNLPEKLDNATAKVFIERLVEEGWQQASLVGLKTLLRHYAYETNEGVEWALASGSTDRRPLALVFRASHWAPFRSLISDIEASFTAPEIRMADRWMRYRKTHIRVDEEMAQRFEPDGWTFYRLAATMTAIEPDSPENLILQQVQRQRRQALAGYSKKMPKDPYYGLPEPLYSEMKSLFIGNSGLSPSRLKSLCVAVRRLWKACDKEGVPGALTMETARLYVDGLFASKLALRSVASYCEFLACFAKRAGYSREIFDALMEVHNAVKYDAKHDLARKAHSLAKHPVDLVDVAQNAYRLLEQACDQDDIRNRRRDYVLAGAIALLSKLQLRSLDLRQGVVGREFKRDSEGWRVDLKTSKKGVPIQGRLASELTRYLDAVLLMDVSEMHLWTVYKQRTGTSLFGNPAQGWRPFAKNWLWVNMRECLNHGPHIVRTLIYDAVAADPSLDAVVAQALCGHGNITSRKFYEIEADRYRRLQGVASMTDIAKGLEAEVAQPTAVDRDVEGFHSEAK